MCIDKPLFQKLHNYLYCKHDGYYHKCMSVLYDIFYCDLLASGYCSVGKTAEMCGFSSTYYFSRVFKQYIGVSPSEYAKMPTSGNGK